MKACLQKGTHVCKKALSPVSWALQPGVLAHVELWSRVNILKIGPLVTASHTCRVKEREVFAGQKGIYTSIRIGYKCSEWGCGRSRQAVQVQLPPFLDLHTDWQISFLLSLVGHFLVHHSDRRENPRVFFVKNEKTYINPGIFVIFKIWFYVLYL